MNSIIFYGDNILTMDQPMYCEAVYIKKGRFHSIGDLDLLRKMADESTREIYLGENCLIPSFKVNDNSFIDDLNGIYKSCPREEIADKVLLMQRRYLSMGITQITFSSTPLPFVNDLKKNGLLIIDTIKSEKELEDTPNPLELIRSCPPNDTKKNMIYDTLHQLTSGAEESFLKKNLPADVVILSKNPIKCSSRELKNVYVRQTYKYGMCLHDSVF